MKYMLVHNDVRNSFVNIKDDAISRTKVIACVNCYLHNDLKSSHPNLQQIDLSPKAVLGYDLYDDDKSIFFNSKSVRRLPENGENMLQNLQYNDEYVDGNGYNV